MNRKADTNRTAAKQVAKLTKTSLPLGESLLATPELQERLSKAKANAKRKN